MDQILHDFFREKIDEALNRVASNLRIEMPTDELYESLILPEMCEASYQIGKFINPQIFNKTINLNNYKHKVDLFLGPTSKYPIKFEPGDGFTLKSNDIKQKLDSTVSFLSQGVMLYYVVSEMTFLTARQFGTLMPWAKDVIFDFNWLNKSDEEKYYSLPIEHRRQVKTIDRLFKEILQGKASSFPPLTPKLNDICRSGLQLFTQYRLSKKKTISMYDGTITINYHHLDVPKWLGEQVQRMKERYSG